MINALMIKMGFIVSDTGIFATTTRFAKFTAEVGVRDGSFKRIADNVYSKNKLR
jgi:hypothetical protein